VREGAGGQVTQRCNQCGGLLTDPSCGEIHATKARAKQETAATVPPRREVVAPWKPFAGEAIVSQDEPMTNEELVAWRRRMVEIAEAAGEEMFFSVPDSWFDDPTWMCRNRHVSKTYLKSDTKGARCLACGEVVIMVPPGTKETT
jgi:uncharacterized protein with PIN domain